MSAESNEPFDAIDLPFALYLNQRLTFDVLAALEDGFSHLSTVSTISSGTDSSEKSGEGQLGFGNIFGFLQIGAKGKFSAGQTEVDSENITEEIVHTPASLFARLRRELNERQMIHAISGTSDLDSIRPGMFVEMEAILHRNPIQDFITTVDTLLPMMGLFDPSTQTPQQPRRGNRGQRKKERQSGQRGDQSSHMGKQVKALTSLLTEEGDEYRDLVAEMDEVRAVITAEKKYFIDPTMNDVIDGTFRILGKATRVIPIDSQETIGLMRRTPLGKLESFSQIVGEDVSEAVDRSGFGTSMESSIGAPAIQIIPLAIFA